MTFWLIASIIWSQILYSFFLTGFCVYGMLNGNVPVGSCSQFTPSLFELLTGGLATAMAFINKRPGDNNDV